MTSTTCSVCAKQLTDPESIKRGCGPDCAETLQGVLSSCGVTESDLAVWSADEFAARWVGLAFKAIQANRRRDVQQFFDTARRMMDLACAA